MINNIKVIIVDDHPVVREGVKSALEGFSDISVPGQASCGTALMEEIGKQRFDVILLDVNLSDKSGFEILAELKEKRVSIPVLIFSMYEEKEYALPALKAGAKGYIHKNAANEEIASAVRKVASGQSYMSDTVQELVRLNLLSGNSEEPLHAGLSAREYQVMLLLAKGRPNKQIGFELNISEKTVSTFRSRILEKLKLTSKADLVKYVMKHKLLIE